MLKITQYGDVTRFDLARTLAGRGRYWTTAYLVDGTLVDTGCAHTAPELLEALQETPPVRIVNTHTHEDHIGANGPLQRHVARRTWPGQRRDLEIQAHPLALPVMADPRGKQPLHPYRCLMWAGPNLREASPSATARSSRQPAIVFRSSIPPATAPITSACMSPGKAGCSAATCSWAGRIARYVAGTTSGRSSPR